MTTLLLEIAALDAGYGSSVVLHGVNLVVKPREAVALVGANGAGKTTLMRAIMGLVPKCSGSLVFAGRSMTALKPEQRARSGIGYSPEGRRVFPGLTVQENLEVAAAGSSPARRASVARAFEMFPQLAEKREARGWQLSGGQQQMLAIARALMSSPRLLLLDEPSLGLSPLLATEVITRVRDIVDEGTSVLLAEQNVGKALEVCDRTYVMKLGRIVNAGPSATVRESTDVRQAFLGA